MSLARALSTALLAACAATGTAPPVAAGPPTASAQDTLDLIAGMPVEDTFRQLGAPAPPTGPFSSWTQEQRRSFPGDLGKLCAGFWSFIDGGDGPTRSRVLPGTMPGTDEVTLVMDVCLLGHMPGDWPEHGARLQATKEILDRANRLGGALHLPARAETGSPKTSRLP